MGVFPVTAADTGGGGFFNGLNAMQDLNKKIQENEMYKPNIQSDIDYKNAMTQGQNINNQYLPQKNQLANANQALQNQYYGPNIQSEMAQRNAQTNNMNTMTPLQAQQLQMQNQYYPQTQQANIAAQKAMANYRNMGGGYGMGAGQKDILGFQKQIQMDNPDFTPDQVNQAASAYINGDDQLPDGTKLPELSGIGKSYVDQIIKRGTTAQGLNQQRFAVTTDAILNQGKPLLPSVTKYAGLLGKGKGNIDAVASSLGSNSPDYNNYLYFTRTFVPYAAGEMMRSLGVNASDTQKELYTKVVNPISWDQNPQGAMDNYNKMVDLFENTVSKTVGKSTSELRSSLRKDKKSDNDPLGIR